MTADPRFGDFCSRSAARLGSDREQPAAAASPEAAAAAAAALQRLVSVIGRYLDDEVRWLNPEGRGPWSTALSRSAYSIRQAAAALAGDWTPAPGAAGGECRTARDVCEAARALLVGRDLLQTHFATRPDGSPEDLSDWAPVIASPRASRALLAVLAAHARAASVRVSALLLADGVPDPPGRAAVRRAAPWLIAFNAAVRDARSLRPVADADLRLIEAIPVNVAAGRPAPAAADRAAALADGVITASERLRRGARDLPSSAHWDPGMNAPAMRNAAVACAATAGSCEVILRSLAARADELGMPGLRDCAGEAAAGAAGARLAWLAAAGSWDHVSTDADARMTRPAADALSLAAWTRRLARSDPSRALARGPSGRPGEPGLPAPGHAGVAPVIAAVHYAAAAVTRLGEAGGEQVRVAAVAGRLYVPTRSVSEGYDVPRRMALAPGRRVDVILRAYAGAAGASAAARRAAAAAAAMTGAPSQVLSAAAWAVTSTGDEAPAPRDPPGTR